MSAHERHTDVWFRVILLGNVAAAAENWNRVCLGELQTLKVELWTSVK